MATMIGGFIGLAATALIATAPFAYLIMLFAGNVGVHVGYLGCIPAGFLFGFVMAKGKGK